MSLLSITLADLITLPRKIDAAAMPFRKYDPVTSAGFVMMYGRISAPISKILLVTKMASDANISGRKAQKICQTSALMGGLGVLVMEPYMLKLKLRNLI